MSVTVVAVIKSFASRETAALFSGRTSRRIPADIRRRALQKLVALHAVVALEELSRIPGHRLEKLRADRAGQYSLRVNDQWRICFTWRDGDAYAVEVVDYDR